jgi:tRNA(Ile)-lysidine synthetase-like protein
VSAPISPPTDSANVPDLLPFVRAAAALLRPEELAAPLMVGVSGGPDSLALLHVLRRWAAVTGVRLHALHVDHALRPESAAEAARVVVLCRDWAIPVTVRVVAPGAIAGAGLGLEEGARRERYRLFAAEAATLGARVVALGHHADDQAETLLLHLLRGAGLAGLAGMPTVRRSGDLLDRFAQGAERPALWRPLLAARRATIVAYCRQWSLDPSHDPSNDDRALRRNAIRHTVIPALTAIAPAAPAILARSSALLADDEELLALETTRAWARCAVWDGAVGAIDRAAFRVEHRALQRRLVRHGWRLVLGDAAMAGPGTAPTEAAREAILTGRTGGRWALPAGVTLLLEPTTALLGPTAALDTLLRRRLVLPTVAAGWTAALTPGTVPLDAGWSLLIAHDPGAIAVVRHIPVSQRASETGGAGQGRAGIDATPAAAAEHTVSIDNSEPDPTMPVLRTWRAGDWLRLPGGGRQKLQDWFTDRQIPRYVRQELPLLALSGRVLWIAGLAAFPDPTLPLPPSFVGLTIRVLYNGSADDRAGVSLSL